MCLFDYFLVVLKEKQDDAQFLTEPHINNKNQSLLCIPYIPAYLLGITRRTHRNMQNSIIKGAWLRN